MIKKILIAEDDPDIREALIQILQSENYIVDYAIDGQEATKKLMVEAYDLLITDFNMPHMDGIQLLAWCREKSYHFPVIFITANRDLFPHESLALSDCCASLMRKPISMNDLINEINKAQLRNHHRECSDNQKVRK